MLIHVEVKYRIKMGLYENCSLKTFKRNITDPGGMQVGFMACKSIKHDCICGSAHVQNPIFN